MDKQTVLITGGAGYIGSHTVRRLCAEGYEVVVLDNLVYGHTDAIIDDVELVVGSVSNRRILRKLFKEYQFIGVIHFAAFAYVGESVTDPLKYYRNNTAAPLALLEMMEEHNCKHFVFSSTCATYGEPEKLPLTEDHPQQPMSPYGRSKLMLEWILQDCDTAWGLKSTALRYFNASGCSTDSEIGEDHNPETHLIPLILQSITKEVPELTIFGTDYPTPDGSCIRDYIHVEDLASAHISALEYLINGGESVACNLGTGVGTSVWELIDIAEEVTGLRVPVRYGERRPGDPAHLVASPQKAKEVFGWEAGHKDVREMIESSWKWMSEDHGGHYLK